MRDFAELAFIFDVWSLGSILLEILSGFPLWLSLKSRVQSLDGFSKINYGLFGVAGRDNAKILNKQNQLIGPGLKNLMSVLKKGYDYTCTSWVDDAQFMNVFCSMLNINPGQRISPDEILEHPFLEFEAAPEN